MIDFLNSYIYLITFVIICISIGFIFFLKKFTFIKKNNRIVMFSMGAFQLLTTISFTIYGLVIGAYHHLLFTDLCPNFAFLSSLLMIGSKKENKVLKAIAPWMFLGALLTMLGSHPNFEGENLVFGWLSYFRHTNLLLSSLLILSMYSKYSKKDYAYTFLASLILLIWVSIACIIPWSITGNDKWAVHSTGLLKPSNYPTYIQYGNSLDETIGDYAFLTDIGIPYPLSTAALYSCASILAILVMFIQTIIKNKFTKNK